MSSIWGRRFVVDIFGESHGPKIGVVIHGVTPGIVIDFAKVRAFLDRRRAGGEAWSTPRREADDFEVVSGYREGHAEGTPLCVLFHNRQQNSADYAGRPNRPGHADYTGFVRYEGYNDPRGGGHFSGRLTAPLVFAGAVAAQLLEARGIYAATHIRRIADVEDAPFDKTDIPPALAQRLAASRLPLIDENKRVEMEEAVTAAASQGDSVGGVVECALCGVPAGAGSPMMDTVEGALASILFAVPAVKGVSFGEGFGFAAMRGSEANDAYTVKDGEIVSTTNHNGGVLGGITTGMPVVFEAAIKPTASISLPQQTVNLETMKPEMVEVKGRHDACIVPRAAAAIEAAACIALIDLMMERGNVMGYEQDLATLRERINDIDTKMVPLFEARMQVSGEIAEVKQRYDKPVFDAEREDAVITRAISRLADTNNAEAVRRFYRALMDISKQRQHERIAPAALPETGSEAVGFLGLPGSFSHIAALGAFDAERLRGYDTFEGIFVALQHGEIGLAILPAENTDTGSITAVADLLAKYGFYIVAEQLLSVTQSLLGIPGATVEDVHEVYTHPEPIMQCSRFLSEHPDMKTYPALSTSQAAMKVADTADPSVACIASSHAAPIYGLSVLAEGIQNSSGNCTRFVVIARRPELSSACDKTSVIFKVEHKPGSLCEVLRLFSDGGVNILKLESRPLKDRPFEYLFHLDFEGSLEDDRVARVIEAVRGVTTELIWLGSYPRQTV